VHLNNDNIQNDWLNTAWLGVNNRHTLQSENEKITTSTWSTNVHSIHLDTGGWGFQRREAVLGIVNSPAGYRAQPWSKWILNLLTGNIPYNASTQLAKNKL